MKKILNKTIKLKHLLLFFLLIGLTKFGFEVYQSYFYIEIAGKYPPKEAFEIIAKERAEKWWLRV